MSGNFAQYKFEQLRSRAEALLKKREVMPDDVSGMDILSLIYELEVHEIELQMQNEELRKTRLELEESRRAYAELFDLAPAGYVVLDARGSVVSANRKATELLAVPSELMIGRVFSSFLHFGDFDAYFRLVREAVDRKDSRSAGEIRLLRARTAPFYARVEISPARSGEGKFIGWRIVFGDVSDRKRGEEELKKYAEKLERSNRELQDFAFIASHDLQEPLRKVQAFGDRLKKLWTPTLSAEGADYLERMCKAAARLQDMVQGLLDYSRVYTRGTGFGMVDLGLIVRDVIADLDLQIELTGAIVETRDLPVIQADPSQMRQLFQNLISNSLKFRRAEQSQVEIRSERAGTPPASPLEEAQGPGCWRIFVQDNGIGFDEKYAERIFSLFERLHGRSAYTGCGMGLAIAKRIVERHGGKIEAQSSPGKGATFIITLPARQPETE